MARAGRKKPIRYYSPKRRAIYSKGDEIPALLLFELFGWTCYLCKQPIDRRKRCPDWRAGTIEHLIPLAEGGTHTWDNVVPAHAKCNFDKGQLSYDIFSATISA
jgi:5-methylcytosine-specific restriction endonuclease McrA